MKKKVGIIGFGDFSWFMCKHIQEYCDISVYSRRDISKRALEVGAVQKSLEEVCNSEIVIFSVVVQHMEEVVKMAAKYLKEGTIVLDISSVKVKPTEIMMKYLPHTEIIPTHPLFGLKSGENGIEGLNMVICDIGSRYTKDLIKFCRDELKLNVLERTPEQHDKDMAYVQGLTHFIARALTNIGIPDTEQKTLLYGKLQDLVEVTHKDSQELFLTLETQNPYAAEIREGFIQELMDINKKLEK